MVEGLSSFIHIKHQAGTARQEEALQTNKARVHQTLKAEILEKLYKGKSSGNLLVTWNSLQMVLPLNQLKNPKAQPASLIQNL